MNAGNNNGNNNDDPNKKQTGYNNGNCIGGYLMLYLLYLIHSGKWATLEE